MAAATTFLRAPMTQLDRNSDTTCGELTAHSSNIKFPPLYGTRHFGSVSMKKQKRSGGANMVREFQYKGETFRITAHGIAGHEEIFIVHMEDGEEGGEISIDRMTEENDTSAPLEEICVMLCDRLIPERDIKVSDLNGPFAWRQGRVLFDVHDGVQDFGQD
jgi:hypothetical protein